MLHMKPQGMLLSISGWASGIQTDVLTAISSIILIFVVAIAGKFYTQGNMTRFFVSVAVGVFLVAMALVPDKMVQLGNIFTNAILP